MSSYVGPRTARFITIVVLVMAIAFMTSGVVIARPTRDTTTDTFKSVQGYIDLNEYLHAVFYGERGASPYGDSLGQAMCAGDVDGDGMPDLIISSQYADGEDRYQQSAGEVYIYFSKGPDTFMGEFDIAETVPDVVLEGGNWSPAEAALKWVQIAPMGKYGFQINVANFNGDQYMDLVVSAADLSLNALRNGMPSRAKYGEVYVYYGRPRASWPQVMDGRNDANARWTGNPENGRLGHSLDVGDFNGDGSDDILAGTPGIQDHIDQSVKGNRGGAFLVIGNDNMERLNQTIFVGGSNQPTWNVPDCYYFQCPGIEGWGGTGSCLGDVNSDGYSDAIIGTYTAIGGSLPISGGVHVIIGREDMTSLQPMNYVNETANLTIYGADSKDYFGWCVETGDFDGDGIEDLMVGAPQGNGWNNAKDDCGEVYIIWGMNHTGSGLGLWGTNDTPLEMDVTDGMLGAKRIIGGNDEDLFGQRIYAADLDGDNRTEIFASSLFANGYKETRDGAGELVMVYGRDRSDLPVVWEESRGNIDSIILGGHEYDMLGGAVVILDVNGDGINDVITSGIEADGPNGERRNCGEVYILTVLPFGTRGMEVLNGYDVGTKALAGGKTCFSEYKDYHFRLIVTSARGLNDIKLINFTLDPGGADVKLQADLRTGTVFSEVSDPNNYVELNTGLCSVAQQPNEWIHVDMMMDFAWDFPTEDLINITATITNTTGKKLTDEFVEVFRVENDLDLHGNLKLEGAISGNVTLNGSWVRPSEPVGISGIKVVYEGSTQCVPDQAYYGLELNSEKPTKWNVPNAASGQYAFEFMVDEAFVGDSRMHYDIDIVGIGGETGPDHAVDVSEWNWTFRIDGNGPNIQGIKLVEGSTVVDGVAYVHDTHANVTIEGVVDEEYVGGVRSTRWGEHIDMDTLGIRDVYVTHGAAFDVSNATPFREMGGLEGRYYDLPNFDSLAMVRKDSEIDFGLDEWGVWGPTDTMRNDHFSVRWTGYLYCNYSSTYNFYISADNDVRFFLDDELVYDQWDHSGSGHVPRYMTKGFHPIRLDYRERVGVARCTLEWQVSILDREVIPPYNLFHIGNEAMMEEISEGTNTISMWAVDWLGNIGPLESFDVLIDTTAPTMEAGFDDETWYNVSDPVLALMLFDAESAIDVDLLEFKFDDGPLYTSVSGNLSQISSQDPKAGYTAYVRPQGLASGEHTLTVQCWDRAYNPSGFSAYPFKVDVTAPVMSMEAPDKLWEKHTGRLNVSAYDHHSNMTGGQLLWRMAQGRHAEFGDWQAVDNSTWVMSQEGKLLSALFDIWLPEIEDIRVQIGAYDSVGNFNVTAECEIDVKIPETNYPPVAVLAAPIVNKTYISTDPIFFSAEGSWDPNPSDNGSLAIRWYKEGIDLFGANMRFNETLLPGNYTFLLTVSDGEFTTELWFWILVLSPIDYHNLIDDGTGGGDGDGDSGDEEGFSDTERLVLVMALLLIILLLIVVCILMFLYTRKRFKKDDFEEEEKDGWIDERAQVASEVTDDEKEAEAATLYGKSSKKGKIQSSRKGSRTSRDKSLKEKKGKKGKKGKAKLDPDMELEAYDEPEALPPAEMEFHEAEDSDIEFEDDDEFEDDFDDDEIDDGDDMFEDVLDDHLDDDDLFDDDDDDDLFD